MEKKNWQSVLPKHDLSHLKMSQRSKILKAKLPTLLRMISNPGFKLDYQISMTYFQLTLVNLLLSLEYRVLGNQTLSIKWLSDIMRIMDGKQLSLRLKMLRLISMHIN